MSGYIEIPIEINAGALIDEVFAELAAEIEGWTPADGNFETFLIRAIVYRLIQPLAQLAADVPAEIFDRWGEEIVELKRQEATAATVTSTWTLTDTDGHTIPAGTEVGLRGVNGQARGFRVALDVEVPNGSDETAAGEVILEAIEAGIDSNELSEAPSLETALGFVEEGGIVVVGKSSNGTDAEAPLEYLSRLRDTMKTLSPRPVIASDVEILARNVTGIGRATAIDNYNADTEEDEQEKATTVAVTDNAGGVVAAGIKEALEAELEAMREANFEFFVVDADYNEIDVVAKVVEQEGFDHATVVATAKAAIEDWLDPALHGQQPPGDETSWVNETIKRYQDLVTVVNNVEGLDHYTELKFAKKGGTKEEKDVTMTGVAPLPKPATITVT